MYSSTLSFTSALDGGVGGQRHALTTLPPGKTQYQLYRRLGGPQSWSERVRKISLPPGFDPQTVQPIASRYTDYATRPTWNTMIQKVTEEPIITYLQQLTNKLTSSNTSIEGLSWELTVIHLTKKI